jgi:hypothetical protein
MRSLVRRVRSFWATKPAFPVFVPVVLRALLSRRAQDETPRWRREGWRSVTTFRPRTARPQTGLTVFSILRNGIANGYPFIEAYGSWLDYCDRIVVHDGDSDDGTAEALTELRRLDDRVEVVSRPWPERSEMGSAIARFTDETLSSARLGSERLMYVQADEIYTPEQRELLSGWREGAFEFAGCVNFWNSLDTVLTNRFPMRYVRLFPATAEVTSIGDGFSFAVEGARVQQSQELFLHYGWCFPEQILRKHVSHGRLYHGDPGYRARGWLAGLMLEQGRYDRRLLDALAPQYRPVPFTGTHPACMRHLVGARRYDPGVGLELLADGASW